MIDVIDLVRDCENQNGSIDDTELFDKRLIETRKWFNNGVDPFEHKYYCFDFKSAQFMLDQGVDKERIASELGITTTNVNGLIKMHSLNDDKWRDICFTRVRQVNSYILYRDGKKTAQGTIEELAEQMKTNIGTIRYWKSSRYQTRKHEVNYRMDLIKN